MGPNPSRFQARTIGTTERDAPGPDFHWRRFSSRNLPFVKHAWALQIQQSGTASSLGHKTRSRPTTSGTPKSELPQPTGPSLAVRLTNSAFSATAPRWSPDVKPRASSVNRSDVCGGAKTQIAERPEGTREYTIVIHRESPIEDPVNEAHCFRRLSTVKRPSQPTENTDDQGQPFRVRLPGFISEEPIGLGEVIKRATSYVGLKPCDACDHRAAMLNQWLVFFRSPKP
jgi:hypothetical protein